MGKKSTIFRNLLLAAAAAALAACGPNQEMLDNYDWSNDPDILLQGCFNGNIAGSCVKFEGIYGIDPRISYACARLVDRLPGCEDRVRRARSPSGRG